MLNVEPTKVMFLPLWRHATMSGIGVGWWVSTTSLKIGYWPKNATTLVDMIDCHHGIICRLPSWQLGNPRFYRPWSCKNNCNFLLTLTPHNWSWQYSFIAKSWKTWMVFTNIMNADLIIFQSKAERDVWVHRRLELNIFTSQQHIIKLLWHLCIIPSQIQHNVNSREE